MRINGVSSISRSGNVDLLRHRKVDKIFEDSRQRLADLESSDRGRMGIDNQQDQIDVLVKAVDDTNRTLEGYNRRFEISVHEGTNAVMVKVIDTTTEEVIREIPPEKILDMVAALWEMAGIIIDRKI